MLVLSKYKLHCPNLLCIIWIFDSLRTRVKSNLEIIALVLFYVIFDSHDALYLHVIWNYMPHFIVTYLYPLLSHPSLGWLYVFSLFPPPPRPPPQQLLPLTSKPFELNLRYLAQRIYGSGEMYWMTFPWPWLKTTAVASISKNLLVCTIKWEPLIRSLQNMAALLPWSWLLPD